MDNRQEQVSDLGLAASLCATGFTVTRVDKTNPKRVVFCFAPSGELNHAIQAYWSRELSVPAMALMENIKALKARIYS